MGTSLLARIQEDQFHGDLAGRLLEGLGKLFAENVKLYAFSMPLDAVKGSHGEDAGGFQLNPTADGIVPRRSYNCIGICARRCGSCRSRRNAARSASASLFRRTSRGRTASIARGPITRGVARMASKKQKRKDAKQAKPVVPGTHRHPDGDRRRKGLGMTAKQALEIKRNMRDGELPAG